MPLCHWHWHKKMGLSSVWCDFLSSRHWVTWLSSWRTPNLNIPKDCCFLGSISPMNQFSQTTFEVSGWCHLTIRQSMPYSAQVPCGAILVGSCLGGPSGPWTMVMRTKVLVQLDLKVGSATNETWFIHDSKTPLGPRSAKWRLWQFYAIFRWGNWFPLTGWIAWLWRPDRRVLVALGPTCCVGRSLLLALWRWLPCCRVWWVLPSHVWRCRKSLGGWWSSQGCSD